MPLGWLACLTKKNYFILFPKTARALPGSRRLGNWEWKALFKSSHKFSSGFKSGVWLVHSRTLTSLFLNHLWIAWTVVLSSLCNCSQIFNWWKDLLDTGVLNGQFNFHFTNCAISRPKISFYCRWRVFFYVKKTNLYWPWMIYISNPKVQHPKVEYVYRYCI